MSAIRKDVGECVIVLYSIEKTVASIPNQQSNKGNDIAIQEYQKSKKSRTGTQIDTSKDKSKPIGQEQTEEMKH